MADDIERWLADEPVLACPETPSSALAAGSAIIEPGLTPAQPRCWGLPSRQPSAWLLWTAASAARRQARQAETNYNLARQAVEDYFNRVSEDTLLKEQDSVDIRRLRGELLKTALPYYREFLRQHENDPKLRASSPRPSFAWARSCGSSARQTPPSRRSMPRSPSGSVCGASPGDHDLPVRLAQSLQALGEQYAAIRKFPPALAALGRSRAILKTLADEPAADSSLRASLALCDKELGIAEGEDGKA